MKRRTVMTTQVVVEERVRLNKRQIRKQIKVQKAIANGVNIAIMVLTTAAIVIAIKVAWDTMQARVGGFGGEILVLPALAFAFLWGLQVGKCDDYDQGAEDDGRYIEESQGRRRA